MLGRDRLRRVTAQDERGSDGAEPGDAVDQRFQTFGTGRVDVDKEAVLAGEAVEADDLRDGGEMVERGRDPGVRGTQPDDGMDAEPNSTRIDDGPEAGDDPSLLESFDAG